MSDITPVVEVRSLSHHYGRNRALDEISVTLASGTLSGLIGPDGVGKSTLMGLIAGAKVIQRGTIDVLGGNIGDRRHRQGVCPRIAYMPQGLGKNLYPELSVFENLDFFGRLFLQPPRERRARIDVLLAATGLDPFLDRPAGKLSGGMRQKLGLCCALIHDPDLLLLDEPTTGVDPLSRQQFWALIANIRGTRPHMSVLVSTAYMDEAERFDWLIAMDDGHVLAAGSPASLKESARSDSLEAAYVALLPDAKRGSGRPLEIPPHVSTAQLPAIKAEHLTRRFGDFIAVKDVSFSIEEGEIFGFLGSNGCGKTTTMKMLTGLLPASVGSAELFGKPVTASNMEMRNRVGYMTQNFSLYSELTVGQNLWLHARLFHLPGPTRAARINVLVERFGLGRHVDALADRLPLGVRQRLSLAVAILHEPDMLILDEPTSGVDPVARDEFWELLVGLSRHDKVTIFISTHFMNEALRCDRISLMHAGTVLASDTPARLIAARNASGLEEAFIAYISEALEGAERKAASALAPTPTARSADPEPDVPAATTDHAGPAGNDNTRLDDRAYGHAHGRGFRLRRMLAYSLRETLELFRDPVRLAFAFLGSVLLMFTFGFGITTDVNHITYAVLDLDHSPDSRGYASTLAGSRYFLERPPLRDQDDMEQRLQEGKIEMAIEIPPNFGRLLGRGGRPSVSAWIDGANTARAATVEGYVQGVHASYVQQLARDGIVATAPSSVARVEMRYRYNPTFESIYAMVPSVPAILLMLIPAILMAVSVVKEKEMGSITNFYVTPSTRLEFLLGKELPYVMVGFLNFAMLTLMAVWLFGVPVLGSVWMLAACALAYVAAVTGIGLLISTFTSSQVAAVFVTTIVTILPTVQFSGLMQPISTLEGGAYWMGRLWPTGYYMHASMGAFTKALPARQLLPDLLALLAFLPVLMLITALLLRKQEH